MTAPTLSESETQALLADYQEALSLYSAPASAEIALIKFIARTSGLSGQTDMELSPIYSLAAEVLVKNSSDIPIGSVCKRFLPSPEVEQITHLQSVFSSVSSLHFSTLFFDRLRKKAHL